jgi:hypothetical protein
MKIRSLVDRLEKKKQANEVRLTSGVEHPDVEEQVEWKQLSGH